MKTRTVEEMHAEVLSSLQLQPETVYCSDELNDEWRLSVVLNGKGYDSDVLPMELPIIERYGEKQIDYDALFDSEEVKELAYGIALEAFNDSLELI